MTGGTQREPHAGASQRIAREGVEAPPLAPAQLSETHISVVVAFGDQVWKIKKPVRLPFVDLSSREARRQICDREVELNRRLAPDVYLGVLDVVDGAGWPVDHLVAMRRLPGESRLSALVGRGEADDAIQQIAKVVAEFHGRAAVSDEVAREGRLEAVASRWEANFDEMRPFVGSFLDATVAGRIQALVRRYLAGRRSLFEQRITEGKVRDGHGDLLADDIFCLPDGPRILDCVEFDDRLRFGDVVADVAFLAMDLERLGHAELADRFLGSYAQHSSERWPATLMEHYVAYRAHVRAKVTCLRTDLDPGAANELLRLCSDHIARAQVAVVLVGGLPGTGKSTLAAGLANRLAARHLRSDVIRKQLAGMEPSTPANEEWEEGLYSREATATTYRFLLDQAAAEVGQGVSVVLDASWADSSWRVHAADLAKSTSSVLVELRCEAPADLAAVRLARRAGTDPSDATAAVAAAMARSFAPWPTASAVDSSGLVETMVDHAMVVVRSRLNDTAGEEAGRQQRG